MLVDLWVGPDDRDSERNVVQIDQPQLGLPSKDFYFQPESQRNLVAYHNYMTEVGLLTHRNDHICGCGCKCKIAE